MGRTGARWQLLRVCGAATGRAEDTGPGTPAPKGGAVGPLARLGAGWGVRQGNHEGG